MGKLIKYEFRKQRTSRVAIFIALAVTLAGFWTGILFDNNEIMSLSIIIMSMGAVFVLIYVGIEGILVFNRDLRTKQSYMLWMLPKSIWEILGAKFISAFLQMLIVFGISCAAVGVSVAGAVLTIGGLADLVRMGQKMSRTFVEGGIQWTDFVYIAFGVFLAWTLVIMTGFLAVILARTVLVKSKFAGGLAVILFFAINFAIERIYDLMNKIPGIASSANFGAVDLNIWDVVFYIVVCLALFGASGLLAEKKLSV